jgi:predicted ATPase
VTERHEITVLYSDIVDSTAIWERATEDMASDLAHHDQLLSGIVEAKAGRVIKHTGDGIVAVFDDVDNALEAALDAQLAMLASRWVGVEPLRIRVGVHCGVAQPRAGDYFGPAMNLGARVMSAAAGGQILLTDACVARGGPPSGTGLRDLGDHRLKGIARPQRIYALTHPELPECGEPIGSLNTTIGNLPPATIDLVGRTAELTRVVAALEECAHVTIVGPGGVGKTLLAVHAAHTLAPRLPDGVWFADLGSIGDPHALPDLLGSMFGLQQRQGENMWTTLRDALAHRQLLLVLDNCEHLLEDVAGFVTSIAGHASLRTLATSREPLRCAGERRIRLEPLAAPESAELRTDDALKWPSVELFVARARSVNAAFALNEESTGPVVDICRRLDGLPLALELAAARVESLPVDAIARRLERGIALLRTTSSTVNERQRALDATFDWSFDLLSETERDLFLRCAVFRGSFSLDAAAALIGDPSGDDTCDLLEQLVAKSMVQAHPSGFDSEPRWRLLRPSAEYGKARLDRAQQVEPMRALHAQFFRDLAVDAGTGLPSSDEAGWIARLDEDFGNLWAALEWLTSSDPERGLRMAIDLYQYWIDHDLLREGMRWLTSTREVDDELLARALGLAAVLGFFVGENVVAEQLARESLNASDRAGSPVCPEAAVALGSILLNRLETDAARSLCERALEVARAGDPRVFGRTVSAVAAVQALAGDTEEALDHMRAAVELNRPYGPGRRASALVNLAFALQRVDPGEAVQVSQQAIDLSATIGSRYFQAFALMQQGIAYRTLRDTGAALRAYGASLRLLRDVGLRNEAATVLEEIARLSASEDPYAAVTVFGAASAVREAVQLAGLPGQQVSRARELARLRETLDPAEYEIAWEDGRALTLDDTTELAVGLAEDVATLIPAG